MLDRAKPRCSTGLTAPGPACRLPLPAAAVASTIAVTASHKGWLRGAPLARGISRILKCKPRGPEWYKQLLSYWRLLHIASYTSPPSSAKPASHDERALSMLGIVCDVP